MSSPTLLQPEKRVLATLEADGSRRWLRPRLSMGGWWHTRRAVAYFLIAILTLVPFITVNGKPAVLFDLAGRKLHLLGQTFLPRDTVFLALLMVSWVLTIFLTTTLLGRVWCGWTCPQTVYMEFVYRPIERLFLGRRGVGGKPGVVAPWRYVALYAAFLLVSLIVAHTFLAYFVGAQQLMHWVTRSPLEHPWSFVIIAVATGAMMFNFSFFREQMCLIACPYGRFQSVMLDRNSLIVMYDRKRGEPRRGSLTLAREAPAGSGGCKTCDTACAGSGVACDGSCEATVAPPAKGGGDCVACTMCVQVCPTGIDIRDGLQMECINCTQCIDACDAVMTKVGKPTGLIRYSSQSAAESAGESAAVSGGGGRGQKTVRARVVVYSAALVVLLSTLVFLVVTRAHADVLVVRNKGLPFVMSVDGRAENTVLVQITNRLDETQELSVSLLDAADVQIVEGGHPIRLEGGASTQYPIHLLADPKMFHGSGTHRVTVRVRTADGRFIDRPVQLYGPAASMKEDEHEREHR